MRVVQVHIDVEIPAVPYVRARGELDPVPFDLTDVYEARAREAARWRHTRRHDGVLDGARVIRELESHSVLQHRGFKAELDLLPALCLEVRIADCIGSYSGTTVTGC